MAVLGAFGACASSLVLSRIVSMCFLLVVLGVAISAIRTFLHPDAQIAGGIRWIGLALSGVASFVAVGPHCLCGGADPGIAGRFGCG
jgi:hypothetical protein